jgi:hypothetical protein
MNNALTRYNAYIKLTSISVFITISGFFYPLQAEAQGLVGCSGADDCDWDAFVGMITGLIGWLIIIATSVAALLFMYAGFLYLTSGGDDSKVKQAKAIFINTAIGFAIMLIAVLLVETIVDFLTSETWRDNNAGLLPI